MADVTPAPLQERAPRRAYSWAVACIALATFAVSLLWSLAMPPFTGPDEPRHYNSVVRLVDGGGWPDPYQAFVLGSTWQAVRESGTTLPDDSSLDEVPAPEERALFTVESDLSGLGRDQMVQHPPGYYLIGAAVVQLAGGDDLRWDEASALLRVMSALIVAGAVPFIAGTVRWATGSRWAGALGAMLPLLIPWFAVSGSRITNDALLVLACSATIYLLVRAWHDARRAVWLLPLAGVAYGVALFSKGYALMLAPAVVILAIGAAWRATGRVWRTVLRVLIPGAIALALGGWWWVRNLVVLGKIQPSQLGDRERLDAPADGYGLDVFVETFFTRLNSTFWGRVGYVANQNPSTTIVVAGILLVLVVIAALLVARSRWMLAILLSFPLVILVTIFQNAHAVFWDTGDPTRGTQGRYLYSGIAAFALAFAALVHWALARRAAWMRSAAVVATGAGAAVVTVLSMLWVIPASWATQENRTPAPLGDPVAFMNMTWAGYVAIAIAAALLLAAGTAAGARVAFREPADPAGVAPGADRPLTTSAKKG